MRVKHFVLGVSALALASAPASAQEVNTCRGPGVAFGVTTLQCSSCEFRRSQNARPEFGFHAEPVLLRTSSASPLRPGDIVEAVNGQPITTRAGADQFAYPKPGTSVVRVRRNGSPIDVTVTVGTCDTGANDISTEPGEQHSKWKGVVASSDAVVKMDSATVDLSAERTGRFGFGVSCTPSCTRAKASDGTQYYKFDGYPPIIALREGSPAEKAGLRVGDVIAEVDGRSILREEGALRFLQSDKARSIQLTVIRDGKRTSFVLKVP